MTNTTCCNANSHRESLEVSNSVTPREVLAERLYFRDNTWGSMADCSRKYSGACFECGRYLGGEPVVLFNVEKWAVCVECVVEGKLKEFRPPQYPLKNMPPEQCGNCHRDFWMVRVPWTRGGYNPWDSDTPIFCSEYCRRNYVSVQKRVRPDPIECPVCRETFEPQRKSAKYCGPTCRQRAKRLRDALDTPIV